MSDDMEVRCAALRMEYQKRMVHSNFIGIILIFYVFCIKTKDEHQLLMVLYKLITSIVSEQQTTNIDIIKIEIHFKQKTTFNSNTFLLDQKVFKKSRLTFIFLQF
jgi:hypothetical protein